MIKKTPHYQPVIRKIEELIASEYNPRKITGKELEDLKESIAKFGIVEFPIVNVYKERKNILISGHQRITACKELGITEIECIEVKLDIPAEKELNIRMNKAGGSFDYNLLDKFFQRDDLLNWGFLESELPQIEDLETKEMEVTNPVYPIVPKFGEKYDYVVIFATNEIDIAYLDNFFELDSEKSYKNSKVGVGRVVEFEKFKNLVKNDAVG